MSQSWAFFVLLMIIDIRFWFAYNVCQNLLGWYILSGKLKPSLEIEYFCWSFYRFHIYDTNVYRHILQVRPNEETELTISNIFKIPIISFIWLTHQNLSDVEFRIPNDVSTFHTQIWTFACLIIFRGFCVRMCWLLISNFSLFFFAK